LATIPDQDDTQSSSDNESSTQTSQSDEWRFGLLVVTLYLV
jgi:hypothetical protein